MSHAEAPKLLPDQGAAPLTPISAPSATQPVGTADHLPELMSRLQKLGAADTNLAPGEATGICTASVAGLRWLTPPAMTQHFESVADQPTTAVEQVLAKVEAWQVAQRDGGTLRY